MNNKRSSLTGIFLQGVVVILFLSLAIFTTCSLEGDILAQRPKHVTPENKTFIVFDNNQGICTVSVYGDYRRRDEDKITDVPAGGISRKITWTSGYSVPFYFSYRVTIKSINDFSLNYVPEPGRDQKAVRIDADTTTIIKIPTLSETLSSPDTLLSNNSYLFIQNNSSYSFELYRGTSSLKPDNISSSLVNNGERAQYTINPGPASNYRLSVGGDYKGFPGSIANFEAGHVYNFDFNGSISLVGDTELKLKNINGVTIPQPPAVPVVITSNGFITLRWTAVESATAYEIWISTVNDSTSASKYGTDVVASLSATISGLNNGTTYYFWLKAKNNLGTSGFSPVASGIPSASTVKPPDPQTAPSIIAGNRQFTVSWQAVEDTSVYEVWVGTTNTTQNATKRGDDVTGLSTVITGLNNGTTYYVWIKAKNNIGVSGFSLPATGKPLGTPGTPTLSPDFKQLLVTWTAVAGADEYEVYYGIGTPTTLVTTTTGTTATITGLTNGTTYYVRLRAKNINGVSDYGPSASGIPNNNRTAGLYRGNQKISNQNLADSLAYISSNAVSGDEYFIVLGANESISPKTLTYSGKTVGITLMGYGSERTISLSSNGSMFTVNSGVTLTLDENITLVGRSINNNPLVHIIDGSVVMNEGAKIIGNTTFDTTGSVTCCVHVYNGTFTMNGGKVSGNTSSGGSAISVDRGTFIMNNGEISGNTAPSSAGGGVTIMTGTFTMNGGKISKNTAFSGGGVDVGNGTFTMNGGEISGNTTSHGGGGVNVGGIFTMSGGEISGNISSSSAGGGVYVGSSGTFTKSGGGTITGYASDTVNGNVAKKDDVVQSNWGHAVYVNSSKRRETTAGPGVNLNSKVNGTAGGWEN